MYRLLRKTTERRSNLGWWYRRWGSLRKRPAGQVVWHMCGHSYGVGMDVPHRSNNVNKRWSLREPESCKCSVWMLVLGRWRGSACNWSESPAQACACMWCERWKWEEEKKREGERERERILKSNLLLVSSTSGEDEQIKVFKNKRKVFGRLWHILKHRWENYLNQNIRNCNACFHFL